MSVLVVGPDDAILDVVITGGENVSPVEVENVLSGNPGVAGAVVVGVLDREWGERAEAAIVPSCADDAVTAEELTAYCRDRLAGYKVPKWFHIVEALPLTSAMKVDKRTLRSCLRMPDIGYDDQQHTFAAAIAAFCAHHAETWRDPQGAVEVSAALWTGLGDMGVLGLSAAESGAKPLDIAAAHEALGRGGCPGPLWQTVLIVATFRAATGSRQLRRMPGDGRHPRQMPWAVQAGLVMDASDLTPDGGTLWRCESIGVVRDFVLLGFEPAAEIRCVRAEEMFVSARAKALAELALAAYLAGAAQRVIEEVAGYVRTRRQFRRVLSEFQSVAHPLAACQARVSAATSLVQRAASRWGAESTPPAVELTVALASAARAARAAVYQAHQAYGGIGFAAEGPLSWTGSRIGQLSTEAEALWRARPLRAILPDG